MKCHIVTLVWIIFLFSLIGLTGLSIFQTHNINSEPLKETNYIGNLMLGIAPNTPMREPTIRDVDTKIRVRVNDNIYTLYESREMQDIGKTFLWVN